MHGIRTLTVSVQGFEVNPRVVKSPFDGSEEQETVAGIMDLDVKVVGIPVSTHLL